MEIISLQFAIFAITVICLYHLSPAKIKRYVLLAGSLYFYLQFDLAFFWIILSLGFINYALVIWGINSKKTRTFSSLALTIDLAAFGLIKVLTSRYPAQMFNEISLFKMEWLLPVGFSFYILQLISLQFDVRSGRMNEVPSPLDFAVYLIYFPKILSGPIEKPKAFFEKLSAPLLVDNSIISKSLGLIFVGLIRKLFIANLLARTMPVWSNADISVSWIQVFGYVLLVYNDFAGYTAIVRGVSLLMGIELSANFQQPFFSRNFSEFWNRWHISLSTWLKETIFFPVARKLARNSGRFYAVALAVILPPMATMLASGFWHGVSLAMLLWGGLQGLLLIFERVLYDKRPNLRPQFLPVGWRLFSMALVFVGFSFTMVPFAVGSVKPTLQIWRHLILQPNWNTAPLTCSIIFLGSFSFVMDYLSEKTKLDAWWEDFPLIPRAAVITACLALLAIAIGLNVQSTSTVFIYQGF